jgi:hypothetical protein
MDFKIGDLVADKNMKGSNGEWPCFMGRVVRIGSIKFKKEWIPSLVIKTLSGKEEIGFESEMVNLSAYNRTKY